MEHQIETIARKLGLENLDLARKVERLATIDGGPNDYQAVSMAAESLSSSLRSIGSEHRSRQDRENLDRAATELSKILREAELIRELHPHGTSAFQLRFPGESDKAHNDRLREWELHGRKIRVAQVRLAGSLEDLQSSMVPVNDTAFDRRTSFLVGQVGDILSAISERCRERSREMLALGRYLRENAEVEPETWEAYSKYICMLTGRKNDGSIAPETFFYSNLREYLLARLEDLAEVTKLTPYLMRAISLTSAQLSASAKARYSPEHDEACDRFFDPAREDFARNMNDRLLILQRHQAVYAPGEDSLGFDAVYAHLRHYVDRIESIIHHLANAERIVEHLAAHAPLAPGAATEIPRASTTSFLDLSPEMRERLLDWLVETASKSAGEPDSPEIASRGYFPHRFLDRDTFRRIAGLEGARFTMIEDQGEIAGCAIVLHGEVPDSTKPLKDRYAEDVRTAVVWWINIDPEARGKGLYDCLNDEMLLDATGKADALVGRLKVGDSPSLHAFKAHLRRLLVPIGGFEALPHGLHLHLVNFVSPSLRNLYFDYLKIDQDFPEVSSVVQSQCELAKALEERRETATDRDRPHPLTGRSRLADLLISRAKEPWTCRFDPCGFMDAILLFDEREGQS